jgi:uncharacterized protein YdbL (DUF1318 family)
MVLSILPHKDGRVAEHLRGYLADLEDEEKWDEAFVKSQDKLVYAAREARKQIAERKTAIQ